MASFNKVILMGNLTRDPEMRMTPSGLAICKIGLAVNRRYTTKDGEQREETTFVDIDAFGRQAEVMAKYAQKGTSMLVEGRLRLDQWETNSGEKRSKLNVVCENFQFGGRASDSGGGGGGGSGSNYEEHAPPSRSGGSGSASNAQDKAASGQNEDDDDVPF
ncbi:MAG: single-stranded DNA-binding protein [Opitutales bacterium]